MTTKTLQEFLYPASKKKKKILISFNTTIVMCKMTTNYKQIKYFNPYVSTFLKNFICTIKNIFKKNSRIF